jgi:hypothetical protein
MPHSNIIEARSEDEIWKTIAEQLAAKNNTLDYTAQFVTGDKSVTLDIDIDPNRSDDSDKPVTTFTTPLTEEVSFRFRIEKQGLKHTIGKLFGMQDVIVGQPEFDKKFLIQSNDVEKVKQLFSDPAVSAALMEEPVADFEIREHRIGANREVILGLDLEGIITDAQKLQKLFQPFKIVLSHLH